MRQINATRILAMIDDDKNEIKCGGGGDPLGIFFISSPSCEDLGMKFEKKLSNTMNGGI